MSTFYLKPNFHNNEIPPELILRNDTSASDDIKDFLTSLRLNVQYVSHCVDFPYAYKVKLQEEDGNLTIFRLKYWEYLCQQ